MKTEQPTQDSQVGHGHLCLLKSSFSDIDIRTVDFKNDF